MLYYSCAKGDVGATRTDEMLKVKIGCRFYLLHASCLFSDFWFLLFIGVKKIESVERVQFLPAVCLLSLLHMSAPPYQPTNQPTNLQTNQPTLIVPPDGGHGHTWMVLNHTTPHSHLGGSLPHQSIKYQTLFNNSAILYTKWTSLRWWLKWQILQIFMTFRPNKTNLGKDITWWKGTKVLGHDFWSPPHTSLDVCLSIHKEIHPIKLCQIRLKLDKNERPCSQFFPIPRPYKFGTESDHWCGIYAWPAAAQLHSIPNQPTNLCPLHLS